MARDSLQVARCQRRTIGAHEPRIGAHLVHIQSLTFPIAAPVVLHPLQRRERSLGDAPQLVQIPQRQKVPHGRIEAGSFSVGTKEEPKEITATRSSARRDGSPAGGRGAASRPGREGGRFGVAGHGGGGGELQLLQSCNDAGAADHVECVDDPSAQALTTAASAAAARRARQSQPGRLLGGRRRRRPC